LKTLVLGMGNPILRDDGIGIHVVREAAKRHRQENVDFSEASVGGLRILDVIAGYQRVVMVDAIQTRGGQPGDIYRLSPRDLNLSLHAGSSHDVSLPGALALGRAMGWTLPADEDFVIIAIEVEDPFTFGEECTPGVEKAVPPAVEAVLAELKHGTDDAPL